MLGLLHFGTKKNREAKTSLLPRVFANFDRFVMVKSWYVVVDLRGKRGVLDVVFWASKNTPCFSSLFSILESMVSVFGTGI
jgi:hypothetical protein